MILPTYDLIPGDCAILHGGGRVWCIAPTRGLYWNCNGPSMLSLFGNQECEQVENRPTLSGGIKFIKDGNA